MASLYARLRGNPDEINIAAFCQAMVDNVADRITITQLATAFNLDAGQQTSAENLINAFGGGEPTLTIAEIVGVLELAKSGEFYNTDAAVMTRLGVTE